MKNIAMKLALNHLNDSELITQEGKRTGLILKEEVVEILQQFENQLIKELEDEKRRTHKFPGNQKETL